MREMGQYLAYVALTSTFSFSSAGNLALNKVVSLCIRFFLACYVIVVYRYNSTTGTFTVPPGGDGFYYFSVYCLQI